MPRSFVSGSQVDGARLTFTTNSVYQPGSLVAIYNGVTYTPENDFTETGPQEFTFPFDGYGINDLFPPKVGCPLYVTYRIQLALP
jgi:hypothetical protein